VNMSVTSLWKIKVLIELKTVEAIEPAHEAQILNYLKATGMQVGLLVNFKHEKAEIKRFVFNLAEGHAHNVAAARRH